MDNLRKNRIFWRIDVWTKFKVKGEGGVVNVPGQVALHQPTQKSGGSIIRSAERAPRDAVAIISCLGGARLSMDAEDEIFVV